MIMYGVAITLNEKFYIKFPLKRKGCQVVSVLIVL